MIGLILALFTLTSSGLVVANQCHIFEGTAAQAAPQLSSQHGGHTHPAAQTGGSTAFISGLFNSYADEICLGLFLLILVVARRVLWGKLREKKFVHQNLQNYQLLKLRSQCLTLPRFSLYQLGSLRI